MNRLSHISAFVINLRHVGPRSGNCIWLISCPQASTNTLLAHFISLVFTLWLVRIVGKGGAPAGGKAQPYPA